MTGFFFFSLILFRPVIYRHLGCYKQFKDVEVHVSLFINILKKGLEKLYMTRYAKYLKMNQKKSKWQPS